jgi:mRNA-degrading endonuclease RelE of RelBE toxin-antitoxin system
MTPRFSVRISSRCQPLLARLTEQHPDFSGFYVRALDILEQDPANVRRRHNVLKLKDIVRGDGQWRLRLGRFRFRYDIYEREVVLLYCGLRREDTYR